MKALLRHAAIGLVLLLSAPVVARAAETGGEHGEAHGFTFADVWSDTQFWAMAFNFTLLIGVLFFLGRKPILNFLKERRRSVEEGLTEAERLKAEAEARYNEYTERLESLDQELATLRKEMIQAGEAERDRIVAEAEQKAARLRREAKFVIEQQMKQLREELTREAVEAAISAAEQVLRTKTSPEDQERLAEQYLASLSEVAKGEPGTGVTAKIAEGGQERAS